MSDRPAAASFDEIAMPLLHALYNYARWLTKDAVEAEDLVQETGLRTVSLIEADAAAMPRLGGIDSMTIDSWRANGLAYVAVGDLPAEDFVALRNAFPR